MASCEFGLTEWTIYTVIPIENQRQTEEETKHFQPFKKENLQIE